MLKVLVPSDGSASSQCAVRHVISECGKHRALDIHLLNVQPPFSKFISDHSSGEGRMEFHREQARQALAPVRQLLDSAGLAYTVHCEVGALSRPHAGCNAMPSSWVQRARVPWSGWSRTRSPTRCWSAPACPWR